MKQFPVLVPTGDGHVAAVVTVPDGETRGLVVSLPGIGRQNVIGSTLCGRLSERLAAEGLASVRLDYSGLGDSPGLVPLWTLADVDATVEQARAVLRVAGEALGVTRFAAVATCYGTCVALTLVESPSCVGAICLAAPMLEYGGATRVSRRAAERARLSVIRSSPRVRRLVGPLRRALRATKPAGRVVGALAHLDRARLVFLYGRIPAEDHYSERARRSVDAVVATLRPEQQARFDLRMLPWGPLTNFDILPAEEQEAVLDVVLPYVRESFDGTSRANVAQTSAIVANTPIELADDS